MITSGTDVYFVLILNCSCYGIDILIIRTAVSISKSIVVFVIYCQVSHLLDTCILSSSKTKSGESKKETLGKPFLLFLMLQFPQVVRSYHVEDDTSSQN